MATLESTNRNYIGAPRPLPPTIPTIELIAELLLESPFLLSLRSDEIRELCRGGIVVQLSPGSTLEQSDGEYLVLDGLLAVKTVDDESGARGIGLFGPGEQLISHASSRIKATTDTWLLRLPDDDDDGACIIYEYGDDDEAALI